MYPKGKILKFEIKPIKIPIGSQPLKNTSGNFSFPKTSENLKPEK